MPRYEFKEGSSNKFWEITLQGKQFTTTYGRIGASGQSTVKKHPSEALAKKEHDRLVGEKTKKGYKLVGGKGGKKGSAEDSKKPAPARVVAHRNPELEAKLIEDPDDTATYLVYADWLQSKGDPRGELIVLQHAGKKNKAEALIAEHKDHFLGMLKSYTKALDGSKKPVFDWHLGFIRGARLAYNSYAHDEVLEELGVEKLSITDALSELLKHPSGALLQDLLVPMNMLGDGCYFEPLCKAIAKRGAPTLRRLRLGEYSHAGPRRPKGTEDRHEISWTKFGDASGLWKALPHLEHLVFQGCLGDYQGGKSKLGTIVAPRLQHLEVMSGGVSRANIRAMAGANWPEMRHLDIWFGSSDYGFSGKLADIEPILDGRGLPKLKHLGLMNAEFTDELCDVMAASKVLPRLEELSLALGTMSDKGAAVLAQKKSAFSHLRVLDVEENFLSNAGKKLLKGLFKDVRFGKQNEPETDIYEETGGRYVSVAE